MEASQLLGLAVCYADTGADVGWVEELLFNPAQRRLWALRTRLAGEQFLVPIVAIRALTADAVIVPSGKELVRPSTLRPPAPLLEFAGFLKAIAITEEGRRVARVADVAVYPADGRIVALIIAVRGWLGLSTQRRTIGAAQIRGIERGTVILGGRSASESAEPPPA